MKLSRALCSKCIRPAIQKTDDLFYGASTVAFPLWIRGPSLPLQSICRQGMQTHFKLTKNNKALALCMRIKKICRIKKKKSAKKGDVFSLLVPPSQTDSDTIIFLGGEISLQGKRWEGRLRGIVGRHTEAGQRSQELRVSLSYQGADPYTRQWSLCIKDLDLLSLTCHGYLPGN